MSSMSDYLENEILDHVLATGAYTAPTNVYVGLSTATFADDNSGTEISGSGYARVAATFAVASSGSASTSAGVEFPTATGTWGTISHYGIFDALTGGNLLIHGALTTSKLIESGDTLKINSGDLTITAS